MAQEPSVRNAWRCFRDQHIVTRLEKFCYEKFCIEVEAIFEK